MRPFGPILCLLLGAATVAAATRPSGAPLLPLDELKPGMTGEVWTVFKGTEPEPFTVEVTGVVRNALGPGKSLILCELTDERVQKMGAVAGMSGSPLYIDGRLAGALAYQVQKFETVRYAGFTPAADLVEVSRKSDQALAAKAARAPSTRPAAADRADDTLTPLTPVFAGGGLAPAAIDWLAPQFESGQISPGEHQQILHQSGQAPGFHQRHVHGLLIFLGGAGTSSGNLQSPQQSVQWIAQFVRGVGHKLPLLGGPQFQLVEHLVQRRLEQVNFRGLSGEAQALAFLSADDSLGQAGHPLQRASQPGRQRPRHKTAHQGGQNTPPGQRQLNVSQILPDRLQWHAHHQTGPGQARQRGFHGDHTIGLNGPESDP